MPDSEKPNSTPPAPIPKLPQSWRNLLPILLFGLLAVWFWWSAAAPPAQRTISYAAFKQHLAAGEVRRVEIQETEIRGELAPGTSAEREGTDADDLEGAPGETRACRETLRG